MGSTWSAKYANTTSRFPQPQSAFVMQMQKITSEQRESSLLRVPFFRLPGEFYVETLPSPKRFAQAYV
jgi:hypothetical protein